MVNVNTWKWLWPILRNYSSICPEELGEIIIEHVRKTDRLQIKSGDHGR
jgi:hypothetical protein